MSNLAALYSSGNGDEQNYKLSMEWAQKAVEYQKSDDKTKYANGKINRAFKQMSVDYLMAAQNNDPAAMFCLGNIYDSGMGVKKNEDLSLKWYERAARLGDVDAIHKLSYTHKTVERKTP